MRRPGQVCAALRVRVPRGRVVREQRRAPRVARAVQPDLLPLRVRHDARRRRRRELEQARAFHQLLHAGRPGELAEGRAAGPLHLFALGADGPFLRRVEALHAHRAAPAQLALADAREFALGKALEGRRRRRRVVIEGDDPLVEMRHVRESQPRVLDVSQQFQGPTLRDLEARARGALVELRELLGLDAAAAHGDVASERVR
mmetsp:Transcript_18292/g.56666  ORF Transcript_18292/g.56666 Transcript_18292/m.56666 type:complete len:202 (+) Transcript_18292:897-1502(+)